MKVTTNMIETSELDDFLYLRLTKLLEELKVTLGGRDLDSTLRRHNMLKVYLMSKQIEKIRFIEENFFNEDGSLNYANIKAYHDKYSTLQH